MSITIARRFCGPATSGNGGYTAGLVARQVSPEAPVEVTLRKPPPLETPMAVVRENDVIQLRSGDVVIAEGLTTSLHLEPLPAISFEEATAAASNYRGRQDHPFPTCFSCGLARTDGLGLEPGDLEDGSGVAAAWTAPSDLLEREIGWAALDCPGGWSVDLTGRPMVLGRMAAHITGELRAGGDYVIRGWLLGVDGRKAQTATAMYDAATDEVIGMARSTWIAIDPATIGSAS